MMQTRHATHRAQQRGIPPIVGQWLDDFGEELHDGHGGVIRFFSRRSIRALERGIGREPVRRMWEFLDSYKVESSHDGRTITIGRRYRRMRRP